MNNDHEMCWSGPASLSVATIGVSGSLWARAKGAPRERWLTLLYFTGMELLQAITYSVINMCHLQSNVWLTRISYIHIAFQPFFVNIFGMTFIPEGRKAWARKYVYVVCSVAAMMMLYKFYVPDPSMACNSGTEFLCGQDTCSYHGEWHIAWRLYMNSFDEMHLAYWVSAFLLPILYGSWRWSVYHFVVGPLAASMMTSNKDEMPAIWCLTSIGFLITTHIGPLERWLETPKRLGHDFVLDLGVAADSVNTASR